MPIAISILYTRGYLFHAALPIQGSVNWKPTWTRLPWRRLVVMLGVPMVLVLVLPRMRHLPSQPLLLMKLCHLVPCPAKAMVKQLSNNQSMFFGITLWMEIMVCIYMCKAQRGVKPKLLLLRPKLYLKHTPLLYSPTYIYYIWINYIGYIGHPYLCLYMSLTACRHAPHQAQQWWWIPSRLQRMGMALRYHLAPPVSCNLTWLPQPFSTPTRKKMR